MSNKLFLNCEEANHVCDKTQYNESSLWEKIKLNIHLIFCAVCRKYSKNNIKLTKLLKRQKVSLNGSEKQKIQSTFEQELKKQYNK